MKCFIKTTDGGALKLINLDHIRAISMKVQAGYSTYFDTRYDVVADLTYGTAVLYQGDKEACERYINTIARQVGCIDPTQ